MNIAVITGASSGLGKEYVSAVLKMRPSLDEIWIIARREKLLNEIKNSLGNKVRVLALDITDNACTDMYKNVLETSGANVSLLINNAGFGKLGNFEDLSTVDNADMVRLNCEALTVMTSLTLPFMKAGSEIINICSIASFAPNTRMAVYSSTKAYIMSFSRALRSELKNGKMNVLAVCPGPMETEFLSIANIQRGASKAFDTLPRVNPAKVAEKSLLASKAGKAVYTNLFFYKLYRVLAKILPHSIVMKMCGT